ncbi:MAG: response regulator [Ktedonobacterales bacterium]
MSNTPSGRLILPSTDELDSIPPEMKQLFIGETSEDLQDVSQALAAYEQHAEDATPLHTLAHITHKMKGAAATLGFDSFARIAIFFEETLKAAQRRRIPTGIVLVTALAQMFGLLQAALDAATHDQEPPAELVAEAEMLYQALLAQGEREGAQPPVEDATRYRAAASGALPGVETALTHVPRPTEGDTQLRVELPRLDELMNQLSALSFNRASLVQTRNDIVGLESEIDAALTRLSAISEQITDLHPLVYAATPTMPLAMPAPHDTHPLRFQKRLSPNSLTGVGEAGDGSGSNGGRRAPHETAELELEQYTELDHALRALSEVVADLRAHKSSLHTQLAQLEQVNDDQQRLTTDIQKHAMHMRLVPLETFIPSMRLSARVLAANRGKAVELLVEGEQTEIDRVIGEALAEPLTQLIRNAIVHGIESPEERIEQGKPPTGVIRLVARNEGDEITIIVSDDGEGVNPHKMIASAILAGVLDQDEAQSLSVEAALALMFQSGISGSETADVIGGSGIGLDEVETAIRKLKGTIQVESTQGKGTRFTIHAPISLSKVQALCVVAAGQSYTIPIAAVERMVLLTTAMLLDATPEAPLRLRLPRPRELQLLGGDTFDVFLRALMADAAQVGPDHQGDQGDEGVVAADGVILQSALEMNVAQRQDQADAYDEIPAYALAELLGMEYDPHEVTVALIVKRRHSQIAVLVDTMPENEVVVVRALPSRLRRPAIHGATVRPTGQMLLLLDLPELLERRLAQTTQAAPPLRPRLPPAFAQTNKPRILVVDDSTTIRHTLELMLQRDGFEVQQARDGIEAMNLLMTSLPRVMLLDIEMPNLGGLELLSLLRRRPEFADVRIVMLTSRASTPYRERAHALGADAYLVKPSTEDDLIATIHSLLAEAPRA